MKKDKYHMFALTRRNLNNVQILQQWNIAVAYEVTSWLSDTLKIKASRSSTGDKIMKVLIILLFSLIIFALLINQSSVTSK